MPPNLIPRGSHPWGRIVETPEVGSSEQHDNDPDPAEVVEDDVPPEFPLDVFNTFASELSDSIGPDFIEVIAAAMKGPESQVMMNHPEIKAIHKAAIRGEISPDETQTRAAEVFKRAVGGDS